MTEDSAPPTPPTASTAGNPEEARRRMLSRRRSRRIRSVALKVAAGAAVVAVAAVLCVVLEKRRSEAARDREAERIKSVRILAEMNQSDSAQRPESQGTAAAETRQERTAAPVETARADSAEDWASEVLPLLAEACAPSNSAEFVKTVRRLPGTGMVESLMMRFRPMCDETLPLERRKGIAAAIAADVQDIARGLRAHSERRIAQIDAALAEHMTRAEFKEALVSERKGLETFLEVSEKLANAHPGTSRAQVVCAEMLVGMPAWFRQVK